MIKSARNPRLKRGGPDHYKALQKASMQARISRNFEVEFMLLPGAQQPKRTRETDAGWDIFAYEDHNLVPGNVIYLRTGLRVNAPEGYWYEIRNRSSITKEGLIILQNTIDAGYTGELLLPVIALTRQFTICRGDKIGQLTFYPILCPQFVAVETFTPVGDRGDKGFGSSGSR